MQKQRLTTSAPYGYEIQLLGAVDSDEVATTFTGGSFRGHLRIMMQESLHLEALYLRLGYHVEGAGSPETHHLVQRTLARGLLGAGQVIQQQITMSIPEHAPISYEGTYVKLQWAISLEFRVSEFERHIERIPVLVRPRPVDWLPRDRRLTSARGSLMEVSPVEKMAALMMQREGVQISNLNEPTVDVHLSADGRDPAGDAARASVSGQPAPQAPAPVRVADPAAGHTPADPLRAASVRVADPAAGHTPTAPVRPVSIKVADPAAGQLEMNPLDRISLDDAGTPQPQAPLSDPSRTAPDSARVSEKSRFQVADPALTLDPTEPMSPALLARLSRETENRTALSNEEIEAQQRMAQERQAARDGIDQRVSAVSEAPIEPGSGASHPALISSAEAPPDAASSTDPEVLGDPPSNAAPPSSPSSASTPALSASAPSPRAGEDPGEPTTVDAANADSSNSASTIADDRGPDLACEEDESPPR